MLYQQGETEPDDWLSFLFARKMSNTHSVQAISWRKLQLSKAKLKASSRTSALLSGFAMVSMIELQIEEGVPEALLITFAVVASLLVAVHMLALMISTCILPHMEAYANVHTFSAVKESPHEKLRHYVEMAWIFSTGLGILLFLVEIVVQCWVKFYTFSINAAIAVSVIIVPVIILFTIFAIHFYRVLIAHKYEASTRGLEELETIANQLDSEKLSSVKVV